MSERRNVLERIVAALERLAPPVAPPTDWLGSPAYIWNGTEARAIDELDALPLDTLRGIDDQKDAVRENLSRLARGSAAHDMLLWGARGMGKSAVVRAAAAQVQADQPGALALVQVSATSLAHIPALIEKLGEQRRAYLLFIDDLGFEPSQHQENLALRSLLDGGVIPRPGHIRLAVTANRRGIVAREGGGEDAMHERDERDDALALADRFGLTLGFHPCNRETYLSILRGYVDPLGLDFDEEEALAFAIARGNRSGRTAYQFATELAGRAEKSL